MEACMYYMMVASLYNRIEIRFAIYTCNKSNQTAYSCFWIVNGPAAL